MKKTYIAHFEERFSQHDIYLVFIPKDGRGLKFEADSFASSFGLQLKEGDEVEIEASIVSRLVTKREPV